MRRPQARTTRDGVRSLRRGHRDRATAPRTACALFGPRQLALAAILATALGALVSVPLMRGNRVAGPTGVQKTVAVLPFDNVSGDGGIDYLRLALADEVATALSSTPSLAVRPMASSRRFAGGEGSSAGGGPAVARRRDRDRAFLDARIRAARHGGSRRRGRQPAALARHHRGRAADSIGLRDRLTSRIRDGLLPALGAEAPTAVRCSTAERRRVRHLPQEPRDLE